MNELEEKIKFYEDLYLIRKTEEEIEYLFSQGLLRGTSHGSIGQEAIAVGILNNINIKIDYVTGNHRSHGHYLAIFKDPLSLILELVGRKGGILDGRGGSQHLKRENFITNGITGGMVPIAVGLANAIKINNSEGIVVSFFGDGAMNEGYVMEAFNMAAIWNTPNLFVLENNGYAMSTFYKDVNKVSFEERIRGFGINYAYLEVTDVFEVFEVSKKIIENIRKNKSPHFIEFRTHRFCGHSKSDKREYMPQEFDKYWKERDPVLKLRNEIPFNYIDLIENRINANLEKVREIIIEKNVD